jgi:hypothetical protein
MYGEGNTGLARRAGTLAGAVGIAALVALTPALAQQPSRALQEIPADKARVTGSMVIDFNSRSERSQAGTDTYEIQEQVIADLMAWRGTVQRVPGSSMTHSIRIDVFNPQNPSQIAREVAILRGELKIDSRGRYDPESGRLRIDVVKGNQVSSTFKGSIQGKRVIPWWELNSWLQAAQNQANKLYSRVIDGKVVTIAVKNPDPLRFERLVLAAGPFAFLGEARVSGNLDYDYELGNWLTDQNGITFNYDVDGRNVTDRVSGSIRYVEETGTFTDAAGKKRNFTSYYDYNLRWNEQAVSKDQQFFNQNTAQSDFDSFFSSSDTSKAGLYGRAYYLDTEDACKKRKDDKGQMQCVGPTRSEVVWDLKATKLTYAQLANWMKLEQLVIGPFSDE